MTEDTGRRSGIGSQPITSGGSETSVVGGGGSRTDTPWSVMVLNTDKQVKAAILCDRLVWLEVAFSFVKVGTQYTVCVAEKDVKPALGEN